MCNLANPFDLEEGMGKEEEEKALSREECLEYVKKVLEVLPEKGTVVKELPFYPAECLVIELVAKMLGGRVRWHWEP